MAPIESFSMAGQDVTDEIVRCSVSELIDATTYYKGFLAYIANDSIEGDDSPSYGIYASPAKAGQRYEVLTITKNDSGGIIGLPTTATQISIDVQTGIVYALSAVDVYATYRGHGPIRTIEFNPIYDFSRTIDNGDSMIIEEMRPGDFIAFKSAEIFIYGNGILAGLTGDVDIKFKNKTSGGDEFTLPVLKAGATRQEVTFSAPLKINTDQTLIVETADGKNLSLFRLKIRQL